MLQKFTKAFRQEIDTRKVKILQEQVTKCYMCKLYYKKFELVRFKYNKKVIHETKLSLLHRGFKMFYTMTEAEKAEQFSKDVRDCFNEKCDNYFNENKFIMS